MISQKVVDGVGLQAIGHMPITPVTGEPFNANKYRIRLDIPIESAITLPGGKIGKHQVLRGKDMEVALLPYEPNNHDVLIGMDLLDAYHITIFKNICILSN